MLKLLVIGHQGHGKTEVRQMLENRLRHFKLSSQSTSDYLVNLYAKREFISESSIRENKENFRARLVNFGNQLCAQEPGIIVRSCMYAAELAEVDAVILDGVRRHSELSVVRSEFDLIIYVKRPGYISTADNFDLLETDADTVIVNDGDLKALENSVYNMVADWEFPIP